MSLGEGVSIGLAIANEQNRAAAAESAARRAEAAADTAERRAGNSHELSINALQMMHKWKARAQENEELAVLNAREATAGLIVMNAVLKAMEDIPPNIREKFFKDVVSIAGARMDFLDSRDSALAKQGGYAFTPIRGTFAKRIQYEQLGFGKMVKD